MLPNETENPALTRGFTKFPHEMFGQFTTRQAAVYLAARKYEGLPDGASIGQIMALTGMKRTAVKDALKVLSRANRITVKRRGVRQTNAHTFPDEGGPFTVVPNEIWKAHLAPAVLMLWVSLAFYSTLEHGIFPTTRELAAKMRAGLSTVADTTEVLVNRGLITVTGSDSGSGRNQYQLHDIRTVLGESASDLRDPESDPSMQRSDLLILDPTHSDPESDHQRSQIRPTVIPGPTHGDPESGHTPEGLSKKDFPEGFSSEGLSEKDPLRPAPPGAGGGSAVEQSQGDGQELATIDENPQPVLDIESFLANLIGCDEASIRHAVYRTIPKRAIENAPGFTDLLATEKARDPRRSWEPGVIAYESVVDKFRGLLKRAAQEGRTSLDIPTAAAVVHTEVPVALGLGARLAAARDSDLPPEERRQCHKESLADRLTKHR